MEDRELIKKMYLFAIELANKISLEDFATVRDKWNILMKECENKLNKD